MVRKVFSVFVISIVFASSLAAADEINLTADQMRLFNQQKLSFDTQSGSTGSISEYGSISLTNYKFWVPYQGFNKISEGDFFRIAGYEEEAKEVDSYLRVRNWLTFGGLGVMLAGVYLTETSGNTYDDPAYITGSLLAIVGSGAAAGGVFMFFSNKYPANIAENVAEDFNNRLKERILKGN
jgi:hypothetical protein